MRNVLIRYSAMKIIKNRKSARKKLKYLLTKYDYKCVYCGIDVVAPSLISLSDIICRTSCEIIYKEGCSIIKKSCATIDHIKDLSQGGDNCENNLVIACRYCNTKKSHIKFLNKNIKCKKCNNWFKSRKNRTLCVDCDLKRRTEYLENIGCPKCPLCQGFIYGTPPKKKKYVLPLDFWSITNEVPIARKYYISNFKK